MKTFDDMLKKLMNGEPFSFSRFGDGEWAALLGHKGANCDGHRYFKDMGVKLRDIVCSNPPYDLAMQGKAMRDMGWEIRAFLKDNKVARNWAEADLLHNASIAGRIGEFLDAVKNRNVICVGAEAYDYITSKKMYNVCVPYKNCWLAYEGIKYEIAKNVVPGCIIVYSCSMMANVLIDDMCNMFDKTITQIDAGSVFAPYLGHKTRRYHNEIIERESNHG